MAGLAALRSLLKGKRELAWSWAVLCCLLLFVAGVRFRLRETPLERDEGEYAYGGQLLLQGVLPGQLLYTMKLPGTHAAYACLMAVCGESCAGVHLGFLVVNCATIVLMFWFAQALWGSLAAMAAAATYALVSLSAETLGTSAHATHFVVLCAVSGLGLLAHASRTGRLLSFFGSGVLLSCSVLMKHNGVFFAGFGVGWLIWLGFNRRLGAQWAFAKAGLMFCAGAVAPFLILSFVLWRAHTLETCWLWSVSYARAYANANPGPTLTWRMMMQRMPLVMHLPFYSSIFGVVALWCRRGSWRLALLATTFLLCSLAAVVPGWHFRPHYYVLLIPALALLTGSLVQDATKLLGACRWRFLAALPPLVFAFFLASGLAREWRFFFQLTPLQACRTLYGIDPFPEAQALGDYIRAHARPEASIAVIGSEPEIYFYAHRHGATGYIYTYPLLERQPYATAMREQMLQEIRSARPQFLAQVRIWTSWQSRPGPQKRVEELCVALTPPGYRIAGKCTVSPAQTQAAWDWGPVPEDPFGTANELLLFERESSAGEVH